MREARAIGPRCRTGGAIYLLSIAWLAALTGCYNFSVRPVERQGLLEAWRASAIGANDLSPRTRQTLRQYDLEALYDHSGKEALVRLRRLAVEDPQPDRIFALAEISYLLGTQAERRDNAEAIALFYLSAGYAYHFLFDDPGTRDPRSSDAPFDPRFRLACDLYNSGLAKCIKAAQSFERLEPSRQMRLPCPDGGSFALSVVHHGFQWLPEEFGPVLFSDDFKVTGLTNNYRGYGLGVPLIGTRRAVTPAPTHAFFPHDLNFPITAFFRYDGTVADLGTRRCGQLEFYNPLAQQAVDVNGRAVPLQTDLTTPLAYFLLRTDLNGIEYEGFLHADKVANRTGIYMFEPYQPGKIPVVMVHGLLSSPVTWAPLFNDLRADPALNERFQFWFYLYPSSEDYMAAAADLRQTLLALRQELDPQRADPALDQMVFVGHSMGGLISRLLTEDSGGDFWRLLSSRSLDSLKVKEQSREELRRMFYFDHLPMIRRVIFLGTPHHGSRLSPTPPVRFLGHFITTPEKLLNVAHDLAETDPKDWSSLEKEHFRPSLDVLAPGAPALELLATRPRPPAVHFHSVIGVVPWNGWLFNRLFFGESSRNGTDGVVPYDSAHLGDVDSELIVPADHFTVHKHPLSVLEVRRILLEHLRAPETAAALAAVSSGARNARLAPP